MKPGYIDLGRYAAAYGGYLPDPPPSSYVRFRRWLQERQWRKRKWRHASANVAFVRLEEIIAADRQAVPCGRWVPHVPGVFYPGKVGSLPFKVKPRWRWVAR